MARVWKIPNSDIGRKLGLPRETVRDVVNRKTWTKLPASDPMVVELWVKRLQQWTRCQVCGEKVTSDCAWGPWGPVDIACIPCVNDVRGCPKTQDPVGVPWVACVCYRTGVRPDGQDARESESVMVSELLQPAGT